MTTIRWPSPYGYSLFADDLRREEAGKITLVGLYGTEMIVFRSLPATLPKLALSVTYIERPDESDEPLELVVYFPGDSDDAPSHRTHLTAETLNEFRKKHTLEPEADDPRMILRLDAVFSPLQLKQEGYIRVRMIRGDTEIMLGSLRVRSKQPSGASNDTNPSA
jgi:hypothetical protein